MAHSEELNKAAQKLLEADIRLRTIKVQLDGLDRDLALMKNAEAQMEENIRWLKRRKIVTVASEYKKVLENLRSLRARSAFSRIDRENCLKMYNQAAAVRDKAKQEHEIALEAHQNPKHNVIQVDFSKKNGKK